VKAPIGGFLEAARTAGIRISTAESIDAFRALETIGYADRAAVKDALAVILAKSREEKQLFDACFELYFARDRFTAAAITDTADTTDQTAAADADESDRGAAAFELALERAGRRAGVSAIRFSTQTGVYVQRIMDAMGLAADERASAQVREAVRAFVARQLALYGAAGDRRWRDDFLASTTLWNVDRRDADAMRTLVRALAKRLATRYGRDRRHRRRGQLDVRRTLGRNVGYGGVPFVTIWKRRRIDKPRVLALCDVSGSVANVAQFFLLFLYSLGEALSDVRSFAFSSHLVEVGDVLEREAIEPAIATIMRRIGFGSSDYGRSLADFADGWLGEVDRRTSVVIMGDARSNDGDPRADVMKTLFARAKRVIWLNPEPRAAWGSGDSEMLRYRPYCHLARECRTLRDLERTMTDLLAADAR
jgi:uncharacterized protein with von Willebrand factor type A (vWA) domain